MLDVPRVILAVKGRGFDYLLSSLMSRMHVKMKWIQYEPAFKGKVLGSALLKLDLKASLLVFFLFRFKLDRPEV